MNPVDLTPLMTTPSANARRVVTLAKPVPTELSEKEREQLAKAAAAKLAAGNNATTGAVASTITSIQQKDAVQVSADVLKLTSATLKDSPVANHLGASGQILTSINKAAQGDTFSAASAASAAVEKLSPQLANSTVGAIVNAAVLTTSPEKLKDQRETVKEKAKAALAPHTSPAKRVMAWLDLTTAAYGLANLWRAVGLAGWKVGTFGLSRLSKLGATAGFAAKAQGTITKLAASPLGRTLAFTNKWLPLLNIAGVAISLKTAIDVFRSKKSSQTAKALSVASVGAAGLSLWAGLTVGFGPFLAIALLGIGADVALYQARARDTQAGDTDRQIAARLNHPIRGLRDLAVWAGSMLRGLGKRATANVNEGVVRIADKLEQPKMAPSRVLVR